MTPAHVEAEKNIKNVMGDSEKVFEYGSLQDATVQLEVLGRITVNIPDTLKGYARSHIEVEGVVYPLIIPQAEGVIHGSVAEVSAEELQKLDAYETMAYKRKNVLLESGIYAWVYIAA